MARKPRTSETAADPRRHIDAIIAGITAGNSLRAVCRDGREKHDDFPAPSTFVTWVNQDEALEEKDRTGLAEQYARAMAARADHVFDEIFEIADDASNDWMETKFGPQLNAEHVQRSRLRIDARKWALGKMAPKKYGDKVDVNHAGRVAVSFDRDDEAL